MRKLLSIATAISISFTGFSIQAQASNEFEFTVDSLSLGLTGVSPHVERINGFDRVWRSDGPQGTAISDCTDAGVCSVVPVPARLGNDFTVITFSDGSKRAYFKDIDGSFQQIYSAPCLDAGCTTIGPRVATSELMRVPSTQKAWGVPDPVLLPGGSVRIYMVEMPVTGKCLEKIASYISSDGVSFTKEPGWRFEGGYVDTEVLRSKEGDWLMILADIACTKSNKQELFTSTSKDGLNWDKPEMLAPTADSRLDPAGYEVSPGVFRVYFAAGGPGGEFIIKRGTLTVKETAVSKPQPTVAVKKTTISCAKGATIRKVTGVNPKCPEGFKKQITITCLKGKSLKTVTAVNPKCPVGFRKK